LIRFALLLVPLAAHVALVAVIALNIDRDPSLVRSVLIDKPAPAFTLAAVDGVGVGGFDTAALKGEVTVVNVVASWCIPCRDEHPVLAALKAETGVRMFGINQKDAPENAAKFLAELGNPYDAIGADTDGRVSIDWGVYGVPETFVVDPRGVIAFKHIGPLSAGALETELIPANEKARAVKPAGA
jgi:cytochrome c biogenesis protein CcmG/thiol:disulfide interchange protein DsbE